MCLAIPGRVVGIRHEHETPMATVDFGGATKDVCLAYTPEVAEGDYVIVHAGFAIARLDEAAASESLRLFAEIGTLDTGADPGAAS